MGRELQRREGQQAQICLTTPILTGLDGTEKMSKSLGNYIGVTDAPRDMFGKCMSVPDDRMKEWFTLVTDVPLDQVETLLAGHPRTAKVALARAVTALYHGAESADAAVAEFDRMFREGGVPDEMPEHTVERQDGAELVLLPNLLASIGFCGSTSEARRLIQGGGVRVDGEAVADPKSGVAVGSYHVQAGKRKHARVHVK
jgi:tyrosyl-tRNA synthetase